MQINKTLFIILLIISLLLGFTYGYLYGKSKVSFLIQQNITNLLASDKTQTEQINQIINFLNQVMTQQPQAEIKK